MAAARCRSFFERPTAPSAAPHDLQNRSFPPSACRRKPTRTPLLHEPQKYMTLDASIGVLRLSRPPLWTFRMAALHVLEDAIDPLDEQLLAAVQHLSDAVRSSAGLVAGDHHHLSPRLIFITHLTRFLLFRFKPLRWRGSGSS